MIQDNQGSRYKIGIIGAGFTGIALLPLLSQLKHASIEVYLFEKTAKFAEGHAYRTDIPYHLLNARARDMSAIEAEPEHFTQWLAQDSASQPYIGSREQAGEKFVPRFLYRNYLKSILSKAIDSSVTIHLCPVEVVDLQDDADGIHLTSNDGDRYHVDLAVLATGVVPVGTIPFPVAAPQTMIQPWNYEEVAQIPKDHDVLIVGSGLSMVDAVQTLHHQHHRGKITVVSRHGLLPLPHAENHVAIEFSHEELPSTVLSLSRYLRAASRDIMQRGGDWRTIMNSLRPRVSTLWRQLNNTERARFLRHGLPYWNIHRHRLHDKVFELLDALRQASRLQVMAGRVQAVGERSASIRLRGTTKEMTVPAQSVINCMGFTFGSAIGQQPLLSSLINKGMACIDDLGLGFQANSIGAIKNKMGDYSSRIFTLGPPLQSEGWETVAVPEIRQQCHQLVEYIAGKLRKSENVREMEKRLA